MAAQNATKTAAMMEADIEALDAPSPPST